MYTIFNRLYLQIDLVYTLVRSKYEEKCIDRQKDNTKVQTLMYETVAHLY